MASVTMGQRGQRWQCQEWPTTRMMPTMTTITTSVTAIMIRKCSIPVDEAVGAQGYYGPYKECTELYNLFPILLKIYKIFCE